MYIVLGVDLAFNWRRIGLGAVHVFFDVRYMPLKLECSFFVLTLYETLLYYYEIDSDSSDHDTHNSFSTGEEDSDE